MAMYRIGVTESGDAAIDLSWVQKMGTVDGAVVITKQITHGFLDAVLDHQKKLIVHATLTGYGGSVLEPCVPTPDEQFEAGSGPGRQRLPAGENRHPGGPAHPNGKGPEQSIEGHRDLYG